MFFKGSVPKPGATLEDDDSTKKNGQKGTKVYQPLEPTSTKPNGQDNINMK